MPTLARSNHLFIFFPACRSLSSTYTGQPKGNQCLGLEAMFVCANMFNRIDPVIRFGVLLSTSFATHIAYGQRLVFTALGHLLFACINIVLACSCDTRILLSATPFWKWAFMPQNERVWPCVFVTEARNLLSANLPLLAW